MKKNILILFYALITIAGYANNNENTKGGKVMGTIVDKHSNSPIEYATIAIYSSDKKLIDGGITDENGQFIIKNLDNNEYIITITFMGYETLNVSDININQPSDNINLGEIKLKTNSKELNQVDIVSDQAAIQYKIDKKIVNVGQQLTAISGSAVDILENVPSIKVDIDGNVSLRGSGDFTVLIDGRPTILDPSDALKQIPASAIENIEIITNPSAKYEPDGTSGIVNIVTKKNKLNGTTGIINVSSGSDEQYGADAIIDIRQNKIHYFAGANYNIRPHSGQIDFDRWNILTEDTTQYQLANGTYERGRDNWNIRTGLDYKLTDNDEIGFNASIGNFSMNKLSIQDYTEWLSPIYDTTYYYTNSTENMSMNTISADINYKHTFDIKDHFLELKSNYNSRDKNQEGTNYSSDYNQNIYEGNKTAETGPAYTLRIQADYSKPILSVNGKFETGFATRISNNIDNSYSYEYDTINNSYSSIATYYNKTNYNQNIYAGYGMFSGEAGDFGYQTGLRMEYTYRTMEQENTNYNLKIERADFFPTLHLSYKLPAEQQTMISYTRRIVRPRGWQLEPFTTWIDANNVKEGNPELSPEYVNSFDWGYQKEFGKGKEKSFISVEAYYRITQNKIERFMHSWEIDKTIIKHTYKNVGTDFALGGEATLNYSPTKWYNINIMGDFYDYTLKVQYDSINKTQHNFSWNTRLNQTFKITNSTKLQVNMSYQSPQIKSQGTFESLFTTNAAIKQDLLKRKLSITLQVKDIFKTWSHEFDSYDSNFYQHTKFTPDTPIFTATISYKINNYKTNRSGKGDDGNSMDMDGGEF